LVLGGRLLDRFGKGLRGAPRDALISEAVSDRMRGSAFGLHRAFDTAGALIGVLLSAFLLWWLTDLPQPLQAGEALSPAQEIPAWVFQSIFGVAAFLGLASWLLTFMVTEPNPPSLEANEKSPTQNLPLMNTARAPETIAEKRWLDLPKTYWSTLAILVLFSLANSSDSFLLLRTRDLGYSPVAVVLIYALYNITYSAFSYPFGALSDRFGRWRMIAAGWLIYSLVYLCLALLPATQA